jgi:hypothetical protein
MIESQNQGQVSYIRSALVQTAVRDQSDEAGGPGRGSEVRSGLSIEEVRDQRGGPGGDVDVGYFGLGVVFQVKSFAVAINGKDVCERYVKSRFCVVL